MGGRCTFIKSWERVFKWIIQSKEEPTKAFCTVCTVDFGIGHGGRTDVKRHMENNILCQVVPRFCSHADLICGSYDSDSYIC